MPACLPACLPFFLPYEDRIFPEPMVPVPRFPQLGTLFLCARQGAEVRSGRLQPMVHEGGRPSGMEAGGGPPLEPRSPDVNSLKNIEERKLDFPAATEPSESCFSNKAESGKPFCSEVEMVEIPETPKRGRSTPMSSQISCGAERMPGVSDSYSFQGGNSPLRQPLWGEEMSGTPALHGGPSDKNGVSKISCNRGTQHWNTGSDLLADKYGSTNMSSLLSLWGEFKTQFPAGGAIRPSHQENGKPEMGAPADDPPEEGSEEEDSNTKLSHWWDRKAASVSSEEPLPQPTKDDDPAVLAMFHAVASSCLAVRSQQKDEPDFTLAQKLAILRDLYHTKPLVFLERFRTALREDHLACFRHLSGNYEADFYCAEVRKAGRSKTRHTRVRNKRYAALQELIRGGEYFSDEQMRSRDPLLYEQYIGRYLSDEELQELGGCKLEASCTLSGALLDSYQERVIQQRLQVQQEQEEACLEEEESEDSESDEDEAMAPSHNTDDWVPDRGEKAFLREEFTSRMYQRFLDGKDRDFDYSEVDENPEFDNLDIVSRDEEERYFDEEEPEDADFMEAE